MELTQGVTESTRSIADYFRNRFPIYSRLSSDTGKYIRQRTVYFTINRSERTSYETGIIINNSQYWGCFRFTWKFPGPPMAAIGLWRSSISNAISQSMAKEVLQCLWAHNGSVQGSFESGRTWTRHFWIKTSFSWWRQCLYWNFFWCFLGRYKSKSWSQFNKIRNYVLSDSYTCSIL